MRGSVTVQSQVKTLTALGAMANYIPVRKNLRILRGRFLDEDDVLERSRVCVVNRDLYEALFANDDSREKTLATLGTTFNVIGEFEEPVDTLGRGDVVPETIFIPVTVAVVLPSRAAAVKHAFRGGPELLRTSRRRFGRSRRSFGSAITSAPCTRCRA